MYLLPFTQIFLISGNCDFDDGTMCTWVNLRTDDFDWLIGSGGTGTTFTGPSSDHTQGSSSGGGQSPGTVFMTHEDLNLINMFS